MNDDRSPIDDELLSAVLDGEATPEERALVEASPEAMARLEQLRAAVGRVAEPVAPLHTDVSARLLARALDAAPPATTPVVLGSMPSPAAAAASDLPVSPERGDELAGRRHRRRSRSWAGALAGVAAAVLLVVVGMSLARGGSRDTASDSSGGSASATANESAAADAAAPTAGGPTATLPADLGPLPDTAAVLTRFAVLEASGADFDHQFDSSLASGGATERGQAAADALNQVPAPGTACPVPPITPAPGESWAAAAVSQLPSGPVIVMVDRAGGTGARVLVVDAATCAVLAEGTT